MRAAAWSERAAAESLRWAAVSPREYSMAKFFPVLREEGGVLQLEAAVPEQPVAAVLELLLELPAAMSPVSHQLSLCRLPALRVALSPAL